MRRKLNKTWIQLAFLLSFLIWPNLSLAQEEETSEEAPSPQSYSMAREAAGDDEPRFQLGLGLGLVNIDDSADNSELYYTASLRVKMRRAYNFLGAYLEGEVGYWEHDRQGDSIGPERDFNVGVNVILLLVNPSVDFFLGTGLGVHFLDVAILERFDDDTGNIINESSTHVGANFQVGLDVHMTDTIGVYGLGRFDILEGERTRVDTTQLKISGGLRFSF